MSILGSGYTNNEFPDVNRVKKKKKCATKLEKEIKEMKSFMKKEGIYKKYKKGKK